MKSYQNIYAQKIYDLIQPLVGELMAQGALKAQCTHIGITEETIKLKDLENLAEKLRKGLVIFLGSDGAGLISQKIKKL